MAFCFTLSVLRTGKGALQAGQKPHNHSVTSILDRIEDESDLRDIHDCKATYILMYVPTHSLYPALS